MADAPRASTSPDLWGEQRLSVNNISIHYYLSVPCAGRSGVAQAGALATLALLVWLHGMLMSGGTLLQPANSFQMVLPDARGHGGSTPIPEGSFTMANLVRDAIAVIEEVSPGRPVFLMGHSMGGATAARVAKLRPDLV